jgi:hypothetical protein
MTFFLVISWRQYREKSAATSNYSNVHLGKSVKTGPARKLKAWARTYLRATGLKGQCMLHIMGKSVLVLPGDIVRCLWAAGRDTSRCTPFE